MRLIGTLFSTAATLMLGVAIATAAQTDKPVEGLVATYSAAGAKDTAMVPNAWLFVPQGGTPSPFLAPGKFDAVFEGIISIDLRGEYAFQAQLNGALKVEVNGETVLDVKGTDVYSDVRIGFDRAILGTVATVATIDGKAEVKIPPGTSSGKKLRLRGKGVPDRSGRAGDHYITVQIDVPKTVDDDDKKLLIQLVTRLRKRGHND